MSTFYNKQFTLKEFYHHTDLAIRSNKDFRMAMKENLISKTFKEELMLAVTEINGCELCNVYHTKNLEVQKQSDSSVGGIILKKVHFATTKEDIAMAFAKHYAGNNGNFNQTEWDKLCQSYDQKTAYGILGVIRTIMVGNAYGIAIGSLGKRLRFKPIKNSRFLHEAAISIGVVLMLPLVAIKNLILKPSII